MLYIDRDDYDPGDDLAAAIGVIVGVTIGIPLLAIVGLLVWLVV